MVPMSYARPAMFLTTLGRMYVKGNGGWMDGLKE